MIKFLCATLSLLAADPLVLDNGAIRIEVDPDVFSVRFVGFPGGRNFVEPLHVSSEKQSGTEWVDPGGLVTDLAPFKEHDGALRRGPGVVIEQGSDYVVLLGPESKIHGLRIKKEVRIDPVRPLAWYTVSVQAQSAQPKQFAIRNTARVGNGTTLRVARSDGTIRVLAGAKSILPAVVKSMQYWLIPIPPTAAMKNVVLGAFVLKVEHQNNDGIWTRRIVTSPAAETEAPNGSTFMCLLDDASRSYASVLQGAKAEANRCCPVELEEEWILQKRGK